MSWNKSIEPQYSDKQSVQFQIKCVLRWVRDARFVV